MRKSKKLYILLSIFIVSCSLFTAHCKAIDCNDLDGDAKDECENLEKKAKIYKNIIDLKNKQQDTLSDQLQIIDKEQEATLTSLQSAQKQVGELGKEIADLENKITEKEKLAEVQKRILRGLMQSFYDYDQQGILNLVILGEDFSEALGSADYIEQSQLKVNKVLSEIQNTKRELEEGKKALEDKKAESEEIKDQLTDKKYSLQANENQKQSLLTQTQGEEEKYKDLLAHVEEQKKELFNFSEASNEAEVSASVGSYDKPKSNLASTSWYFSQKDSRWGGKRIGNSKTLMKDYGCAVTCVSMVFKEKGAGIDPGKMAQQKIFYYDLIKWPGSWSPGIKLVSSVGHGNIKWSTVDSEIKKGNPVIVYIRKTNGRGGHYVVVTGKDSKDYIVHDPYFGANLYLGTSKALVGKIGADSKVTIDQMIIYN